MHTRQTFANLRLGLLLAVMAVVVQAALNRFFARDSYQLFLWVVAISAIRGGTQNGTAALGVSAAATTALFMMPDYQGRGHLSLFLMRMTFLIGLGSALCLVGGSVYTSLQLLRTEVSKGRLLNGLLPICSCCKRIRDERGCWRDVEDFISKRSNAEFSHGFCPRCASEVLLQKEAIG